jgi:hypothetical protein
VTGEIDGKSRRAVTPYGHVKAQFGPEVQGTHLPGAGDNHCYPVPDYGYLAMRPEHRIARLGTPLIYDPLAAGEGPPDPDREILIALCPTPRWRSLIDDLTIVPDIRSLAMDE